MAQWLVLNIGSATIKAAAWMGEAAAPALRATLETGTGALRLEGADAGRAPAGLKGTEAQVGWLLETIAARLAPPPSRLGAPTGVGHRMVHGGQDFAAPVAITPGVLARLAALAPLAPGHQPYNLAGIRAVAARWPGVAQLAAFDTAFHHARPRLAQLYALPRAMAEAGILRYGFHGLSYEYIAERMEAVIGPAARGAVVVAHLGSGASLCALRGGRPVATTMGFSALDGLVMGTRAGQVDPGVLIHLMRTRGMDADALEALLGHRSGLLGVSGISADMRVLLASDAPEAAEAVALFVASVVGHVGAMAAAAGGLDGLVFTGGIGANSAPVRARVMAGLEWLGVAADPAANAAGGPVLTRPGSRIVAAAIETDEEAVIVRALRTLRTGGAGGAGGGVC